MSDTEEQIVAELQKKENELWEQLEQVCDEETRHKIGDLIEVNLELETYCNQ